MDQTITDANIDAQPSFIPARFGRQPVNEKEYIQADQRICTTKEHRQMFDPYHDVTLL